MYVTMESMLLNMRPSVQSQVSVVPLYDKNHDIKTIQYVIAIRAAAIKHFHSANYPIA